MQFGMEDGALRYQEVLVPLMFASSARHLVAGARLARGAHVLDVATGTGIVARTAAEAVGASGQVTAIDLAGGMLAVARSQPAPLNAAPIQYIETAIENAPLPAGAFQAAFCQQGLQFFDEPVVALAHIRQALTQEGRLHIALWCALEQHPLASAIQRALIESGLSALTSFLMKTHRLHDSDIVIAMLREGGFVLEEQQFVEVLPDGIWHAADGRRLLAATPLAARLAALSPEQRLLLDNACERELDRYTKNGTLDLRFPAVFYIARPT